MPLFQLGLEPVAIDCSLETLNISPETLLSKIEEVDALFVTNVLGFADKIADIRKICDDHGVLLLEDNCEGLGSIVQGNKLGNFGLASTFSFFLGHHLSTIEGGMVCTDDTDLHRALVMARAHGWDRNLDAQTQKELRKNASVDDFFSKYTFYDLGFNLRPTEINGFVGNIQLRFLDETLGKRRDNFMKFYLAAKGNSSIVPMSIDHMDFVSNFAMPLVFKDDASFSEYKDRFEKADVEIRPIIAGDITLQPFYMKYKKGEPESVPNARFVHDHGFYFGNNPDLTADEVETLTRLLQ